MGETGEDLMNNNDIRHKIGRRIKDLRAVRGISQEDFANQIGLSRSYFGEVETGKRNVAVINLEKIVQGLGVSFEEFFDAELFADNK